METIMIQQQDIEEILFNQEEGSDLSYWEFINNSEIASDDNNNGSIDTLSLDSLPSWNSSLSSSPITTTNNNNNNNKNPLQEDHDGYVEENPLQDLTHHHHGVDVVVDGGYLEEQVGFEYFDFYQQQQYQHQHQRYDVVVNDEEDQEDDDDNDDDLDDELVPWHLSGKMGRNRMRKLGKRVCAKMTNAKRNPFRYVKPGCVHGKHGLGLNH